MSARPFPWWAIEPAARITASLDFDISAVRLPLLPVRAEALRPGTVFLRLRQPRAPSAAVAAFKWNSELAEAARQHALLMAKQDNLSHQLPGEPPLAQRAGEAGARFSEIGENIAVGPRVQSIHTGWMHSPGHRANILDLHFTALGVGVIEDNGQLYAVEDFSTAIANMSIEAQEEKVTALLAARGLIVSTGRENARKLCSDDRAPTGHRAMLILRYEASDIGELPETLERQIRDGKYREAAVGACHPKESAIGIARFRITVLLFGARGKS